jgi:hypothetical protein
MCGVNTGGLPDVRKKEGAGAGPDPLLTRGAGGIGCPGPPPLADYFFFVLFLAVDFFEVDFLVVFFAGISLTSFRPLLPTRWIAREALPVPAVRRSTDPGDSGTWPPFPT